jgi:hypothetical protein
MSIDVSRITPHLIRDNDLVLLSFPDGFIPIRALKTEFFNFLYDPLAEGMLADEVEASTSTDYARNIGFVTPSLPKSGIIAAQPTNVFRIDKPSEILQIFFGIAPSYVRVFIAIPSERSQKNLPVTLWSKAYATAGYIDGFTSPLLYPAPESEIVLVYGIDPGFGFGNILYEKVRPLLWFYVNRVKLGVVRDPELVSEMLEKRGRGEKAMVKTIGGFTEFSYKYVDTFGINPIPAGATRSEVASILR